MSVIIKGMKMPQKCGQCKLFHAEHPMYCTADESHRTVGAPYGMPRPDWCPLIELPPHGRLIAEKTITEIRYHDADGYHIVNGEQLCELEIDAPTVIEAEGENI